MSETTGQQTSGGAAASARERADDVPGDVVAVGPTGETRSTLDLEAGEARSATPAGDVSALGHSGDPVAVDPDAIGRAGGPGGVDAQSTGHGNADDAERTGTAAGATSSSDAGVAGFGTDTGLSSSSTSGALTGDPGDRSAAHTGTGTGEDWTDDPGARSGVTEAATDPVGEAWADDAGSRSATTGAGASGPGERRGVGDASGEGVVERNYADESISTDDVVARDFANRPVSGEGVVERDFANRDITERDIANRGVVDEGERGAPVAPPRGLDAVDAPGPVDGVGAALDPLDPRTGTADDPDNPVQPSV